MTRRRVARGHAQPRPFARGPCAWAAAAALALLGGCAPPADASLLLSLGDNALPGLRAPSATLTVEDGRGEALTVDVVTGDESASVKSPLPVPCDATGTCAVHLRVHAAKARFILALEGADRCGGRAELAEFASDLVTLQPYAAKTVELVHERADFDDDGDRIVNALEDSVCGRFDVADRGAPPQRCAVDDDPCCQGVSPLEGHLTAFAGGSHLEASGDVVDVAPFALDATEVTWERFARCVAAGGCLAGNPEHPVRQRLAAGVVDDEPVTGLVPAEAEELCEFFGERLPTDDEWDFAAAHRADPAVRGRYPWDDDGAAVSCRDDDGAGVVVANFSIPGTACAGAPVAVGSFSSSNALRGAGVGVADLGGNVAEWTLVPGRVAPAVPELPAGTDAVVLRGGGAVSPLALLENDLPVRAPYPASGDVDAWRATIRRLAVTAGFRCAESVDDGTVAPPFAEEPACPAP